MKTEIIYGVHPVFEGLKANRRKFHEIVIAEGKTNQRVDPIAHLAAKSGIPVTYVHRQKLQALTGLDTHQGVAAVVSPYPVFGFLDMIGHTAKNPHPRFLLLIDNIVDPHNLGALIRTALCANMTGVVIPKDRSAEPSPTVSKASAGALEHIRLATVVNMVKTMDELKKNQVWVVGLDKDGDRSIYENDFTGDIALVVGGEENGIRPLVKKNCDFLSFIPQHGPVNSLNASVAGAIAMYEAYRQRQFTGKQ
jgi:23S rRNA (guanosine2251-2'-O)-methyltransferase